MSNNVTPSERDYFTFDSTAYGGGNIAGRNNTPPPTTSFMGNSNNQNEMDGIPFIDGTVKREEEKVENVLNEQFFGTCDNHLQPGRIVDIIKNNDCANDVVLNEKIGNGDFPQWKANATNDVGKVDDEPEDVVCLVKCLYYSIQCCECAII